VGESYRALRCVGKPWNRASQCVAIAPYVNLSNAVFDIMHEYAGWVPDRSGSLAQVGLKNSGAAGGSPRELDTPLWFRESRRGLIIRQRMTGSFRWQNIKNAALAKPKVN